MSLQEFLFIITFYEFFVGFIIWNLVSKTHASSLSFLGIFTKEGDKHPIVAFFVFASIVFSSFYQINFWSEYFNII
jgi:hypothetical protein